MSDKSKKTRRRKQWVARDQHNWAPPVGVLVLLCQDCGALSVRYRDLRGQSRLIQKNVRSGCGCPTKKGFELRLAKEAQAKVIS